MDKTYLNWSYEECWHELDNIVMRGINNYNEAEYAIYKIKELIKPPTTDKICSALSEHNEGEKIVYDSTSESFYLERENRASLLVASCYKGERGQILIDTEGDDLTPKLHIMLGKFYEGIYK